MREMGDYKHSFSLSDIDPNMEFLNHFPLLNPNLLGFPHHDEDDDNNNNIFSETFPGLFNNQDDDHSTVLTSTDHFTIDRKRKATDIATPQTTCANTSVNSSPQVSDNGITRKTTNRAARGKKLKCNEKPREVIHVRAKRGEATDSHSLAERVRRGKINERLRCLQDIVPGCYKTMGMAVMLDEIINYVQSLQNQVEFLSMKLTAASTFHDFNSDTDAMEAMQRAKAIEALKAQNVGSQHGLPSVQFAQSGLNYFGYCPQLPHSR